MRPATTVLIVGGGSGIGRASAVALLGEGYRVIIADRNVDSVQSTVAELRAAGGDVDGCAIDVTDAASVRDVVEGIGRDEHLRGLVNTAGVLQLGSILDVSEEDWDALLQVNLKGTFLTCKAAVEAMMRGNGGSIVNLASQSGRTKSFHSAPSYVASKAGVIGLTMAIAAQHAHAGIRANAVAPGLVETPMTERAYTGEQRRGMIDATPLGRFASAHEVGEVVAFLVSERSSYVTGQTVNVNGGSFMQ